MSDALWWALQPSSLVVLALVVCWLLLVSGAVGTGRRLLALVLIAFVAWAFLPVEAWLARPLEERHAAPETLPEAVDGIIVLGGAVDWRVSLGRNRLSLNASGERVLAGAALLRRYPDATLVFTGVDPRAFAHDLRASPDAASLLFGPAFDGADVRMLGEARSTYEDALLAIERLERRAGDRWLLVTSAWHMPRARATFATLGWQLEPYPVDYLSSGEAGITWRLPAWGERMARLDRLVREWGALLVYRATGRIAPDAWP